MSWLKVPYNGTYTLPNTYKHTPAATQLIKRVHNAQINCFGWVEKKLVTGLKRFEKGFAATALLLNRQQLVEGCGKRGKQTAACFWKDQQRSHIYAI